jgi:excisionase family DNA binding protein
MLACPYGVTTMETQPLLLTIPEAAQALRVSRSTIYRLINDGLLDTIRIRSRLRIRPSDLDRFLLLQQRQGQERAVRFA